MPHNGWVYVFYVSLNFEEMRLQTGEKVLDIHINEYDSLEQLQKDFLNMPKEMDINGKKLNKSKKQAISGLEYQRKMFYGQMARQFYYVKTSFEGVDYYQLHELVID